MQILLSLAQRLGRIVEPLRDVLAAHASRHRAAVPVVVLLHGYLNRLLRRFAAVTARPKADRPAPPIRPSGHGQSAAASDRPPRGFAALCRMTPEVNAYGSQLRHLLASADMKQLLADSPRAGSILRPLCRMLGIGPPDPDLPPNLFTPRRAPIVAITQCDPPGDRLAEPVIFPPGRLLPA